jgi:hypothetical protein
MIGSGLSSHSTARGRRVDVFLRDVVRACDGCVRVVARFFVVMGTLSLPSPQPRNWMQ